MLATKLADRNRNRNRNRNPAAAAARSLAPALPFRGRRAFSFFKEH